MDNRTKLLSMMADGKFHSGQELGDSLSITRSAVWKIIKSLKKYNLDISSVKGRGYCLPVAIEFLDRDIILTFLKPDVLGQMRNLEIIDEIDSTNQCLLDRLTTDDIHGHLLLAEFQTSGRGRRGNPWISPFGAGICLSVGWHFESPVESLNQLSLAVGVAIVRALNTFGIDNIGLKWPNDIICNGRKLGGILLEMRGELAGPCDVVLGVGVNVAFPATLSEDIGQAWIDIASIKDTLPSRNKLAAKLITEILALLTRYKDQNIPSILDEWRQYDCATGKMATLSIADQVISGRVFGIDDQGALLLSVNDEIRRYTAGEISMRVQS